MTTKSCLYTLPLLAVPLFGQRALIGPDDAYVTTRGHLSVASVLSLGPVSNLVAGRCSGLQATDVIGLAGDSPLIWVWPSAHESACQLPDASGNPITGVNDLAVLAGKSDVPGHDAVALVGSHGLRIWRRQHHAAAFQLTTVADPNAVFANARLVTAHRADPSAIYCALADLTSIGVSLATGTAYGAAAKTFQVVDDGGSPTTVLAIAAVDWDADGVADVAALTHDGLVTYDRDGNEMARSSYPVAAGAYANPTRALTVVRYTNLALMQPRECIAWLAPSGSRQCILMRGNEVTNSENDIALAHGDHLAISAADWTLDGEDDLFVTGADTATGRITMLVGAGGLVPWLFIPSVGFDVAVDRGAQDPAPVALADLDGDGDGDLFSAVGDRCAEVQSNVNPDTFAINAPGQRQDVPTPVPGMTLPILASFGFATPPVVAGFGPHEIEATVWQIAANGAMNPTPVSRSYHTPVNDRVQVQFIIDAGLLELGRYRLQIRPVRRNAAHDLIDAGKAWPHSLFAIPAPKDGATPVPGIVPLPVLPPVPPVPPLPPI